MRSIRANIFPRSHFPITLLVVSFFCGHSQVLAADLPEVLIEATAKAPSNKSNLILESQSTSRVTITAQEMKDHGDHTIADALARVGGVYLSRNGLQGQTASVFLRGANSEHTLVFLDGIELNEAMAPSKSFDISFLTPEMIEKVEVIRGAQAVLFGSGAIGGVILITTKAGDGPTRTFLNGEYGSHNYVSTSTGLSGGERDANYSLFVKRESSTGISAADAELDGNSEADGFIQTSLGMRFGTTPVKNLDLTFLYYLLNADVQRDLEGGKNGDDPNATTQTRHQAMELTSTSRILRNRLTVKPFVSRIEQIRRDQNLADVKNSNRTTEDYVSQAVRYGVTLQARPFEMLTTELTTDVRVETGRGDSSFNLNKSEFQKAINQNEGAALLTILKPVSGLELSMGLRYDHLPADASDAANSSNGSQSIVSPAGGISYTLQPTGTRFKVSRGQGFKSPSLFQLYSSFGNAKLKSERSQNQDFGIDQPLFQNQALLSVTRFENQYQDLITYDFATNKYGNIGKSYSRGYEAAFNWRWGSLLKSEISYTSLETKDESTGLALYRRPREAYSAEIQAILSSSFRLAYGFTTTGVRDDILADDSGSGAYNRVQLPTTTIQWIKTDIAFTDDSRFFFRIDNLGNIRYQPTAGFGGDRISFNSGLNVVF